MFFLSFPFVLKWVGFAWFGFSVSGGKASGDVLFVWFRSLVSKRILFHSTWEREFLMFRGSFGEKLQHNLQLLVISSLFVEMLDFVPYGLYPLLFPS